MENYIVSARKYRPSTFKSVVGQKALVATLKNAVSGGKLAHAYLFCGPRGVGKTTCARIFAKTINCMHPREDGEACNECESCVSFNEQRSLNIHELDAASNNSVDDIRELVDQVRIPPQLGKYKVYIIDEVHMLSTQAFNAFLKTLEEPPHYAVFVLATTEKHKILPTILSRCQTYDFSRISIGDMVDHLDYVAKSENITAEPEALNIIAQKADGGLRDALSIFDQVSSYTEGNITYQAAIDNLNVLDYDYYFKITDAILSNNVPECLLVFNEILSKGFEGNSFVTGMASHLRDLLVCKDAQTIVLFDVGASIRDRYLEIAQKSPVAFLYKAIELANECDLNYRVSRNKKLLVELLLIRLCQLTVQATQTKEAPKAAAAAPVQQPAPQPVVAAKPATLPPVAEKPEAPQQQQPAPQPEQPKSAPISPAQAAIKEAEQRAWENLDKYAHNRGPMSFSLRDMSKPKEEEAAKESSEVAAPAEVPAKPFTLQELQEAWIGYAESLTDQAHLRNTMIFCKPELTGEFSFEITIHNQVQQDTLVAVTPDIIQHLRQSLQNEKVEMSIRQTAENEVKKAYTSAEKFNLMNEENPSLSKLKDEFDLIPD